MNLRFTIFDLRFLKQKLVGRPSSRAEIWSARTCPRFENGDMSPHSQTSLSSSSPAAATCLGEAVRRRKRSEDGSSIL